MGHFPFFIEIEGKKGVVVGGGQVAARKIEKLLPFGPALTVIAPQIAADIFRMKEKWEESRFGTALLLKEREAEEHDLAGAAFVIAATDEEAVNAWVSAYCREHGILVNVVDDREKCTFFFPALIKDGAFTAAISTDGKSPAMAAGMRKRLKKAIPEGTGATVELLGAVRGKVLQFSDDPETRAHMFETLLDFCLERGGNISVSELEERFFSRDGETGMAGITKAE